MDRSCGSEDHEPIREKGSVEERLHAHMIATVSGDSRRSYGLFLGLAEDEEVAAAARAISSKFLGLIDLQDTVIGRKARNTGHKAIRARAITDLADFIGWDQRARRLLHGRAGHGDRARSTTRSTTRSASGSPPNFPDGGKQPQADQSRRR